MLYNYDLLNEDMIHSIMQCSKTCIDTSATMTNACVDLINKIPNTQVSFRRQISMMMLNYFYFLYVDEVHTNLLSF